MAELIFEDLDERFLDDIRYNLINSLWVFLRNGFHAMRVMARVPAPVQRRFDPDQVTVHAFDVALRTPGIFRAVLAVQYVGRVYGPIGENVDRRILYSFRFTERAAGVRDFTMEGSVTVFRSRAGGVAARWGFDVELPRVAMAANTILSRLAPVLVRLGVPSRVFGGNGIGVDSAVAGVILDFYASLVLNDDVQRALRRILDDGGGHPRVSL